MPHKLASTFTSFTYDQTEKELKRDTLGDFDLISIQPNGTIGPGCRRRQSGKDINGKARELEPNPIAYQVEITQLDPYHMEYKGIAFFDDDVNLEVTRIAGFVKYIPDEELAVSKINSIKKALGFLVDQDETTWVVTKP